ncbi:MAG: aminopeptidase P family protein [Candidatus Heimdallarchaeota archaeon]|nr:aminopeptidase P family protein [Candidatus Heimdallarchaeota archaeon]
MKTLNYEKRQTAIVENMNKAEIDLFLITPSIDFGYLFKGFVSLSERLKCGMLSTHDDARMIAPFFEKENMQNHTSFDDVITWKEDEDPYVVLKKAIPYDVKKIALEPTMPFEIYIKLQKQFPDVDFVDGSKIIRKQRATKSEAEIERLEKAGRYTVDGMLSALDLIKPGMTELEVLKLFQEEMTLQSGEPSWALVQFDENSAVPHGSPSTRRMRENSVVLIDAGSMCDHYFADITLTTFYGKVTDEFLKVYEIVESANEAALEASKIGIPCEEVDFAARKIIDEAGYGEYFTHRLGHGLGLEVHEEPYMVKGNNRLLVEGNVHTDEPGIYIPNKFGIRIEDDIFVGEKSKRTVSFDRYLWTKR